MKDLLSKLNSDIDQQKANVNLVGYADYPSLGPSHAELNGVKTMSMFKNIKSFFPKDSNETIRYTKKCSKINGPTFISLKSDKKIGGDGKKTKFNKINYN